VSSLLPADPVRRGRIKLLALAAFFALPVVAGYVAYFFDLAPGTGANYGTLIPARPLSDLKLQGLDGRPFHFSELRGKWVLVQFDSGACNEYCERKLYFMRQVRKALGKDTQRIERLWLVTDAEAPSPKLLQAIEGMRMALTASSPVAGEFPAERAAADHVYLVDPHGNLMMRFPRDPDPSRMLKDLQRLMKVSTIG
jgi:cytochrome oxidase Cu insertion factor (SCO1/SenC/PrrC family)